MKPTYFLDAQLPDGSRLAAVNPPVVRPNPSVTIRKFSKVRYTVEDLINNGAMTREVARILQEIVEGGHTMLISGGTGSGKTTLLNALADFIPSSERIVVIEDTSELRINKPNVVCAECQNTHEGRVDFDALLRASLRWRPDRIILGEVRGRRGADPAGFFQHRARRIYGNDSCQLSATSHGTFRRTGQAFAPAIQPA